MALDFAKKKRLEVVVISDVSAQEFPCFGFVTSLANAYTFLCGVRFSRTNLQSIVDRLSEKTQERNPSITPKKQVCFARFVRNALRKLLDASERSI